MSGDTVFRGSPGRRPLPCGRRDGGFTLIELVIVLAVLTVLAAVMMTRLISTRLNSNEASVIVTMREIASAQIRFQASARADTDADGTGEFGFLKELTGAAGVRADARGRALGAPLAPPLLPGSLRLLDGDGQLVRAGYFFRIFLPDAGGCGVGETQIFPVPTPVDPQRAESTWCCYAWPVNQGTSGGRTFFVNQSGALTWTEDDRYTKSRAFHLGDCGAALLRTRDPLTDITGQAAVGTKGRDGNLWFGVK